MADPQQPKAITMWNKKGDKSFDVTAEAAPQWEAQGWSRSKPPSQAAQPKQQAMGGLPGAPSGGSSPFAEGFTHGINPLHGAPAGTPSTGNMARDVGEDMLNLREMGQLGKEGKKQEGFGLMTGTVAGLVGPEALKLGGKAMKGGAELGEKALSTAAKSEAAHKAVDLVKSLRGSIKDANLSERLVQPIREVLDAKFEPMHKALEKEIVPINKTAEKLLKRLEGNATKQVQKEVAHLFERTALDYREAAHEVSHLKKVAKESPLIRALAHELDKEIDTLAAKHGLSAQRTQLKNWYRQMNEVADAAHTSIERSAIRAMVKAMPHVGKFVDAGPGKVGKAEVEAATKLMHEIQGTAKKEVVRKIGQITEKAAAAYQKVIPLYRAIHSGFQDFGNTDDSSTSQLKSVQ